MPSLVLEGVTKRFGATVANADIDLELTGGRVVVLVGQNGAGKSTLVGIVTGRFAPDEGRVLLDGQELPHGDPRFAAEHGVATVFQELMLVPSMTGLENIALALRVSATRETLRKIEEVQYEYGLPARLDVPVEELDLPERQRIELTRALCQNPRILLLDEPTSLLRPSAIPVFLQKVRELAERGLAVLLITHRLDEARVVADHVALLREGRVVARYERGELPSNRDLVVAMVGTSVVEDLDPAEVRDDERLSVAGLGVLDDHGHRAVTDVSLAVRSGEILGLAGVDGNGQIELLEAIAGLRRVAQGSVSFDGAEVTRLPYHERFRRGIHLASGDRRRHGIVPTLTIAEHFEYMIGPEILPRLQDVLVAYNVRPPQPSFRADRLSGGNQQKMILAQACERGARLILLAYPTHGLDVQASLNVRELLLAYARGGGSVVIASSELDELLSVCHRIAVLNRGRVAGIQERRVFDHEQLAAWFTSTDFGHGGTA